MRSDPDSCDGSIYFTSVRRGTRANPVNQELHCNPSYHSMGCGYIRQGMDLQNCWIPIWKSCRTLRTCRVRYNMEMVQQPLPATGCFFKGTPVPRVEVENSYMSNKSGSPRHKRPTGNTRVNTSGMQNIVPYERQLPKSYESRRVARVLMGMMHCSAINCTVDALERDGLTP